MKADADIKIQAPVTVELKISITNGKRKGVVTFGMGNGVYPTEAEMRDAVARAVNDKAIPEGWRLMTKREWWDQLCAENFGHRYAMPGGDGFDA